MAQFLDQTRAHHQAARIVVIFLGQRAHEAAVVVVQLNPFQAHAPLAFDQQFHHLVRDVLRLQHDGFYADLENALGVWLLAIGPFLCRQHQ